MNANVDIRRLARAEGVPLWKIAEALNVSEPTIIRHLRREFDETKKAEVRRIIEQLAQEAKQ